MEPTVQTDDRFDAIDRDKFREMIESKSFAILKNRISRELHRVAADCISSDSELVVRRSQGAATMVQAILRLPDQILEEMKNAPKKR